MTPDRGDLVMVDVHRADVCQRRPALVLSPARYNERSGLAIMCTVAAQAKGYPFEVALPEGLPVRGVVLADHLRSADWQARSAEVVGTVPVRIVTDVLAKLKPL